ncbi:thymidylate synthase [Sorangium cellulosum]|uniref:thymidylate synthase n=1 Tax=Sorangium cellulosum TaxID=56 RepID=A0A2L0F825_SORCE|nr:thymidylate synthase [Sorangium cellulosum]
MFISEDTLDDVLRRIIRKLIRSKTRIKTSRGMTREIFGVLLQIDNPRARLSRTESKSTLFSCLGELLWYLAKTDKLSFIAYYAEKYRDESEDKKTIRGAYGPRLFGMNGQNQIQNVLRVLGENRRSRRAVIQIFDSSDIARRHKEIPCTCTMQFAIRHKRLDMLTNMRSNDAFLGLPHDVFAFTMIQEIMASALNVRMGTYRHAVGSLHLYEKNIESARAYLREGWQSRVSMPRMPKGDPFCAIDVLLNAERDFREGRTINVKDLGLDPYWEDLARILQIYRHYRNNERENIAPLKSLMHSRVYDSYIEKKRRTVPKQVKQSSNTQ